MNIVDALMISVGFDTTKLLKGAKEAQSALDKTAQQAEKSGKQVDASTKSMGEGFDATARKLLGLYALFTGGREIKQFVSFLTQADAALGRFAFSLGLVPQSVSALGMALERNGGSANDAAAAYSALNNQIQAFKTGAGSSAFLQGVAMLSNLSGIKIDPFDKDRAHQVRSIGSALYSAAQKDPGLATYLGQQLNMPSGFIQYSETHSAAQQRAEEEKSKQLGLPSAASMKAAQQLIEQFAAAKQASEDLGRQIFVALSPAINGALKGILDWVTANKEWLQTEISAKVKALADWLGAIDWKSVVKDINDFVHGANSAANAIGGWTTALEALFALFVADKFLNAFRALSAFMGLLRVPLPAWVLPLLGPLAAIGLGASAESTPTPDPTPEQHAEAKRREQAAGTFGFRDFIPHWMGGTGRAWHKGRQRFMERGGKGKPAGDGWNEPLKGASSAGVPLETVRQYIRAKAQSLGIDPNVAEQVSRSEGLNSTLGAGGDGGTSDGPFQLHVGGGLGDAYERKYRHSIHDKRYWRDQVDFALEQARNGGWGPWHGWHGPARAGIGLKPDSTALDNLQKNGAAPAKTPPMQKPRPLPGLDEHGMPIPGVDATGKPLSKKESWLWHGIPDAADYSNRLQRMAAASTIHHHHGSIDNRTSHVASNVGAIHVQHAGNGRPGCRC